MLFGPNIEKMERKRDIDGLIKALKHKGVHHEDYVLREKAEMALIRIGKPAVASLVQVLKDERGHSIRGAISESLKAFSEWDIRKCAVRALGEIGDVSALEPLIEALDDEGSGVRAAAAQALGKMGDNRAVEPLIRALSKSSPEYWDLRLRAVEALGKIGDARAIIPLIMALKDNDSGVQDKAAELLVDMKEQAIEPLIQHLSDGGKVAEVLGRIGEPAVEPLLQILRDEDKDTQLRRSAAKALGRVGDARAAEAVIDLLFAPSPHVTCIYDAAELGPWIEAMTNLFGDYTDLILKASIYVKMKAEYYTGTKRPYRASYDISESNEAIQKLCNIHTQISNNIMHKVSKKEDIEVWIGERIDDWSGEHRDLYETLSFGYQREMAKRELAQRGNPPYDPHAYLNKEAWKVQQPSKKYCAHCGNELSPGLRFCGQCGASLEKPVQPAYQPETPVPQIQHVSSAWYLLPFFLGIIGGLIAWAGTKGRDLRRAKNLFVFGIMWTIALFIINLLLSYALH